MLVVPSMLGADPTPSKVSPQGRPYAGPAVPAQLMKKTVNGAEFKRVSEEQLEAAGITDTKKFGDAWQDPSGTVWSDIAKDADGFDALMDQKEAEAYCKALGAELPSGHPENKNGKDGFPKTDSDFVRLRKYMGAEAVTHDETNVFRIINYAEGPKGYSPQIVPNLVYTEPGMKHWTMSLIFRSSSPAKEIEAETKTTSMYTFDGSDGSIAFCGAQAHTSVRRVTHLKPAKSEK